MFWLMALTADATVITSQCCWRNINQKILFDSDKGNSLKEVLTNLYNFKGIFCDR